MRIELTVNLVTREGPSHWDDGEGGCTGGIRTPGCAVNSRVPFRLATVQFSFGCCRRSTSGVSDRENGGLGRPRRHSRWGYAPHPAWGPQPHAASVPVIRSLPRRSGRQDSNLRSPVPETGALARLSYAQRLPVLRPGQTGDDSAVRGCRVSFSRPRAWGEPAQKSCRVQVSITPDRLTMKSRSVALFTKSWMLRARVAASRPISGRCSPPSQVACPS